MISPYRFIENKEKPSFKIKCFFGFHDDGERLDDVQYKMKSGNSFKPLKCTHRCFHCKKLIWLPWSVTLDEFINWWLKPIEIADLSELDEPMSPGPVKKWQ